MQIYVYSDRIFFAGKVKDLKDFLKKYFNEHSTVNELIKNSLH